MLGIFYFLVLPVAPGWIYAGFALLTAASMGLIGLTFKVVPDYLVHLLYLMASFCAVFFALAFLWFSNDPKQTIILIITILGASSLFMTIWISPIMLLASIIGWLIIAHGFPRPLFIHWLVNLITSSMLGFIVTLNHVRLLQEMGIESTRALMSEKQILRQSEVLKRQSVKLSMAKNEAMEASRAKSDFLANISHELRTPLNVMMGMSDILLDTDDLGEEHRQEVRMIKDAGNGLLAIIKDVLDFSRIENCTMDCQVMDFNLRELIVDVFNLLRYKAKKKDLNFTCDIENDVPNLLSGDSGHLRQVIKKLAENAIKFTSKGGVSMRIGIADKYKPEQDEKIMLCVTIKDTGTGISKDFLNSLFDPFTQADTSLSRKYCGMGLGLSIASRLVKMMGGEISVNSTVNKGSNFEFTAVFATRPFVESDGVTNA